MADLEEHAFKRDKRFIVRLVLGIVIAAMSGLWVAAHLTSSRTGSCAANMFGDVTEPAPEAAPPTSR